DLEGFLVFNRERKKEDLAEVSNTDVVAYLLSLKREGRSAATINRKLASIRLFYKFLISKGLVFSNPVENIKAPKTERKTVEYLSIEEVELLLGAPGDTVKGRRDRAILELLYATGIRVNELVLAHVEDVNLRIGFFTCPGDAGKARIVPIGGPAKEAMEAYLENSRSMLIKEKQEETALFVNYRGEQMTRQGLWKILREYGRQVGLEEKISPHILRNSFAVHMIQNGADLKSLQELLGHEDLATTQIYLTASKNRIKDVYDKTHPRA
ncbi:MAG: tyrosine-type recombinase/integrase, partial [Anaerovoracaceae bacterium]